MKRYFLLSLAALLAIAFLGCSDEEPVTRPTISQELDKDPPAQSGPRVARFEDYTYWFFSDLESELTIVVGLEVLPFCEDGIFNVDVIEMQEVTNPQTQDLVNTLVHGDDLVVTVWPLVEGYCYEFLENDPIAWGTMDVVATDNDLYAWLNDQNRTNTWGFAGHGSLETADGPAEVSAHFRLVSHEGGDGARWTTARVNIAGR